MILVLLLPLLFSRSPAPVSAGPPAPPRPPVNVELQAGLLSWAPGAAPGAEHSGLTFSVQSRLLDEDTWLDVSSCAQTRAVSCDVSDVLRNAPHGCVRLRVRGQLQVRGQPGQQKSEAVEACSREGKCTPRVRLLSSPGSLTVLLSQDHALWEAFADHAKHKVCLGRPGQPQQQCRESLSSLNFSDLEQGQTYCVSVQFLQFSRAEGPPSCPVCRVVPGARSGHAWLVLGLVLPLLGVALGSAVAYVLIFHRQKLKQWFKPPASPESLWLPLEGAVVLTPDEERCSVIQAFTQVHPD
ncbi:uncharacterized protein [Eucyclogobius newberryi]|uniref:uncharacterized protein n=1 Tax=Eucyclogobius newberryi TaxID=166745 RepID=UPI003B5AEE21